MKSRLGKTRLPSSTIIWSPTSWPKPISRVRRHAEISRKGKSEKRRTLLIRKLAEASAIRAPQADTIAHEITASPHPYIIVCGDFNDTPISYTHRTIAQDLDDAFTQSGRGLGISYNQNRFYFRIDNILTSKNLRAYNCTVDRSIKESDHYPIWCYITKRYWKLILKHLILRKQCSKNVF